MEKEKSLARLVYETKRSLQGRALQVEKKRMRHGHAKPSYPGAQAGIRRTKKIDKDSRQRRRKSGEISEQSLAEEIESARGGRPTEGLDLRRRAGEEPAGPGARPPSGLSSLEAAAWKRLAQRARR